MTTFCNEYADAYCSSMITCGQIEASFKADCVTYLKKYTCGVNEQSVTKGYQTFDKTLAATCLADLKAATATCGSTGSSPCSGMFKPASTTNAPCLTGGDCVDANAACVGTGCAKTCQIAGTLGLPCIGGYSCQTGSWCDQAANICKAPQPAGSACTTSYGSECDGNSYCDTIQKKCVALPGVGVACRSTGYPSCNSSTYCDYATTPAQCKAFLTTGQACSSSTPCGPNGYCSYVAPTGCQPRKPVSAACSLTSECQQNLKCTGGFCAAQSPTGGPCASTGDCVSATYCDTVTRTCQVYKSVAIGGTCTDSTLYCSSSSAICRGAVKNPDGGVGTTGTCQNTAVGDSCAYYYGCPQGATCLKTPADAGTGTCTTSVVGSPCSSSQNCPTGNYCATTGCAPMTAAGLPCSNTSQCVSPAACRFNSPDAGVCTLPGGQGASCDGGSSSECKALLECIGGVCSPTMTTGAPCSSYGMCLAGACDGANPDAGIRGTCGAYRAEGAPCSTYIECASSNCSAGKCAAVCP
jgi:hypothetical protein